jgi:hypothetical protein
VNRLQRWVCEHTPWLSRGCWPPDEYLDEPREPQVGTVSSSEKTKYARETQELLRTMRALDAQIDVIAGTDRLRNGHGVTPKRAHERGR